MKRGGETLHRNTTLLRWRALQELIPIPEGKIFKPPPPRDPVPVPLLNDAKTITLASYDKSARAYTTVHNMTRFRRSSASLVLLRIVPCRLDNLLKKGGGEAPIL